MTSGPAMAEVSYPVVFAALWAAGPVPLYPINGETVSSSRIGANIGCYPFVSAPKRAPRPTGRAAHSSAPVIPLLTRRFFLTVAPSECQLHKTEGAGRPAPGSVVIGQSMLARTLRVVSGFCCAAPASDPTGHVQRSARCAGYPDTTPGSHH